MTAELILLPLGVAIGAVTQRVTGIGFALVAGPLLTLVAGPFNGIVLANLLGLAVCVVVLARTWRDVEWRRAALLAIPAVLVIPVGAMVAHSMPGPWLSIVVGGIVMVALAIAQVSSRSARTRAATPTSAGTGSAIAAGAASGFMNVTAGVGGPAMVLYATSTKWDHGRFVATFQLYSIVVNAASLAAKGMPQLPAATVAVCVAALPAGLLIGELVSRRVPPDRAARAVGFLAFGGATATVVKGLFGL